MSTFKWNSDKTVVELQLLWPQTILLTVFVSLSNMLCSKSVANTCCQLSSSVKWRKTEVSNNFVSIQARCKGGYKSVEKH